MTIKELYRRLKDKDKGYIVTEESKNIDANNK